jgi:hypothetical protein
MNRTPNGNAAAIGSADTVCRSAAAGRAATTAANRRQANENTIMTKIDQNGWNTHRIGRRQLLQALGGTGAVGIAGCLGGDDTGEDDPADDEEDSATADDGDDVPEDDTTDDEGNDNDPYLREELENAIANLEAPDSGAGTVVFEHEGEYHTEEVTCEDDIDDPDDSERGTAEAFFEFDDGEAFSVELSRGDDLDSLQNTITLVIPNPGDDGPDEVAIPRSLRPIKPEEGSDGRSAFVIRDGDTWYGGLEFDPSNGVDLDYGETWIAITCG